MYGMKYLKRLRYTSQAVELEETQWEGKRDSLLTVVRTH
jgi:hypothetical protein